MPILVGLTAGFVVGGAFYSLYKSRKNDKLKKKFISYQKNYNYTISALQKKKTALTDQKSEIEKKIENLRKELSNQKPNRSKGS